MKYEALALLLLTACVTEPAETTSTTHQGVLGKCTTEFCGLNSAVLTDGFFHELNLDGLRNEDGFSIVSTIKNGNTYKLGLVNGRFYATLTLGAVGAPMFLAGDGLEDAQIRLKRVRDGVTSYRLLTFSSVARVTDYWAAPINGASTPKIETYKFYYSTENPPPGQPTIGAFLCQNGALLADPTWTVDPMPLHHALVFEGDRIDVDSLTMKPFNDRWFNIGCAETALAKMQLTGQTHAAQAAGFSTTPLMRQTFLKMITADYCGYGKSFTVSGQPLRWTDTVGTMTVPSSFPKRLEARWDANGATCLNVPRVKENPSWEAFQKFGDVDEAIEAECGVIPPCFGNSDPYYLQSYNPI